MTTNEQPETSITPEQKQREEMNALANDINYRLERLLLSSSKDLPDDVRRRYVEHTRELIGQIKFLYLHMKDILDERDNLKREVWKLVSEASFYQHRGEETARQKIIAQIALEADISKVQAEKVLWAMQGQLSESPVDPQLLDAVFNAIAELGEDIEDGEAW